MLKHFRAWQAASSMRIAGPTPPSHCPASRPTLTPAWGLSPGVTGTRSRSCTAGTSGSGWRCLASHSPSTSDTSSGKVAREGEWRDWCQVRRFILIGKLNQESVHVRTLKTANFIWYLCRQQSPFQNRLMSSFFLSI